MAAQGGLDEPVLHTIAVNDVATAAVVSFGVIAALNRREITGEGQEVLTSLMAQSLTFQLGEMTTYDGRPPNDVGARDCIGVRALHRFYQCGDAGWLAIVCERPDEARAVAACWASKWPTRTPRWPRRATERWPRPWPRPSPSGRGPRRLSSRGRRRRRGPGPARTGAFDSDWLKQNDMFEAWRHPRVGDIISVRAYADFSRGPAVSASHP